jgi:peptide/nickel transport system substrate-binding protein
VGALQPEQAPVIQQDPNLVLLEQGVATTHYFTFNSGKPPFDDMRLRQALSMAIDRQALVDSTLYGYGQPGMSVLTPHAVQWLHPGVAPQYDAAAAQQLAQDALNGQRVEAKLLISSALIGRWPYENIAQIVQAVAVPLGIDITIEVVEAGAWNTALREGEYNLTMMPYTLMTGDPDFFMRRWVWSEGDMNQNRSYGYANPRADELAVNAVSETDLATRKAMYDELQEIVAEEVPFTPLYHEVTIYATRKDVHDLLLDVQFKPSLERAYRGQ